MIFVQILSSLIALAGLLALFLTWQRRGVREGLWRFGLPGGWALLVIGLVGWMLSTNPDQGLALGSVVIMSLACAILAWQGLKLAGKPAKLAPVRESETDGLSLGDGYWGRFAVRLGGSLIIVPAFGLLVGLLWRGYAPGNAADVLIWSAIIAVCAMIGALTWLLASRKPYRTTGVLTGAGLIAAAVIYLPLLLGGRL